MDGTYTWSPSCRTTKREAVMWKGWTTVILALWLAAAPFVAMDVPSVKLNNILVSMIIAWIAWYMDTVRVWAKRPTMIIAGWMILAGFVPALTEGPGYLWNNLVSGSLLVLGGVAALYTTAHMTRTPGTEQRLPCAPATEMTTDE
jgi:hypothetical protein